MCAKAVVIGSDHINTLGLVRSIGEIGIPVVFLRITEVSKKSWVAQSRYISKTYVVNSDERSIVDALLAIEGDLKEKDFLFPAGDYPAYIIDQYRDKLDMRYVIPGIAKNELVLKQLLDKSRMIQFAKEAGFAVPETADCDFSCMTEEKKKRLYHQFKGYYPLLIRSSGIGSDYKQFVVINNEKDFRDLIESTSRGKIIIQQYINIDEELGIQGVGLGEQVVIPAIIHKVRTSVASHGSTTYATIESCKEDEPICECKRFISMVGYLGIFDIEIMRSGDAYYFVECNFRNGAYGYSYTQYGCNLPLIWIYQSIEKIQIMNGKLHLINEFSDFRHVLTKDVGLLKWIYQVTSANIHLTANKKDMKPFIARLFSKSLSE